jgi:serine/threonine protein kinase
LAPGTLIDGYRLGQRLGSGVEGTVYRAVERWCGIPVALKLLHEPGQAAMRLAGRIARIHHRLRGTNILATYHRCGRAKGLVYLVFDHLDGVPLAKQLARPCWSAAWKADQAYLMLWFLAEKLATAHAAGIAFGDFAGGNNIILVAGENPVFCDLDVGAPGAPNRDYDLDLDIYADIATKLAGVQPFCTRVARIAGLAVALLDRRPTRTRMSRLAWQVGEL